MMLSQSESPFSSGSSNGRFSNNFLRSSAESRRIAASISSTVLMITNYTTRRLLSKVNGFHHDWQRSTHNLSSHWILACARREKWRECLD